MQESEGKAQDVKPTETYVANLIAAYPTLADADEAILQRYAALRRLLDYHVGRLDDDPGNVFSADQLNKLSTLAIRHEDALGISGKKKNIEPESPSNRPNSIRRNE